MNTVLRLIQSNLISTLSVAARVSVATSCTVLTNPNGTKVLLEAFPHTFVVVGVHGTDPVLRTIHDLFSMIPGATWLLSGYVASLMNWPLQILQTTTFHKVAV